MCYVLGHAYLKQITVSTGECWNCGAEAAGLFCVECLADGYVIPCMRCLGDRIDADGTVCTRCDGSGGEPGSVT